MNKYISKYAPGETHFKRYDPWPGAKFEDEPPRRLGNRNFFLLMSALLFVFIL